MPNELLLIIELIIIYGMALGWFALFGKSGLYCFGAAIIVLANIEVVVLVRAFGIDQTLGNILFASLFLITDMLSELYGKKSANKAVNLQICASITFVIFSQMWLFYTPASGDFAFEGIKTVFANTPRIIIASLVVNFVVQKLDVWLYHKWWSFTEKKCGQKSKFLWLRNNGSTLISQLINAVLFTITAFAGLYDWTTIFMIIASSYVIFVVTSIADTPIVYLARKVYDWRVKKGYESAIIEPFDNSNNAKNC